MTKNTLDMKVYAEQVRLLYKPFMLSVVATIISAILLVISQWEVTSHNILLGWLATILIVTLLRALLAYFYKRNNPALQESKRWGYFFIAGLILAGATWGIGAVILFPEYNRAHQVLIVSVVMAMCAGAVTSLAVMRGALLFFMAPALLPLIALFFLEGNRLSNIIGLMVVLAFFFYLKGAKNIYNNTRENIYLRLTAEENEKAQYKAEEFQRSLLESSPDSIFVLDQDGIIIRVNRVSPLQRVEEFIGQNIMKVIADNDKSIFEKAFLQTVNCKELQRVETKEEQADGLHYFLRRLNPLQIGDEFFIVLISTDITERKQVEQDLIKARDEADLANQAKSAFLSNMSHELRTPLNSILGFGQLLEVELQTEKQKKYITQLLTSGEHLLDLINEILDLSKIEAGKIEVKLQNCSLSSIIDKCFFLIEPLAAKRNIQLINNIPEESDYTIYADCKRYKQVMLNLLSNAIKYNKEYGSVTVSCEPKNENRLRVSVSDTGAGLTEQQQGFLFQPFERLLEHSNVEGSGIGLLISKHLVETMGGVIGVESERGQGSTFWVEVEQGNDSGPQQTTITATEAGPSEIKPVKGRKILYIDDNPVNLEIVENIIELKTPHLLLKTVDAADGLTIAAEQQPDLILTDINMPGMNGYEVLTALQENMQTQHIPVVAISANAMPSDIQKAKAAGFRSYISKPFTIKVMVNSINEILE